MNQGKKLMYISVGLVLGIIIGASFVWWLQNYDIKLWFTFSGKNTEEGFTSVETNTKDTIQIVAKDNKKLVKHSDNSFQSSKSDTSDVFDDNIDTTVVKSKNFNNSSDDIVVAKDELLHVRNIKIEGSPAVKTGKNLDSLLINDKTAKSNANILKVEFWRSPINYRGYLLTDTKLVLYGIYIYEDVSLEIRNNKLYMLYQNNYYLLEKNDDFQPFLSSKLPSQKK